VFSYSVSRTREQKFLAGNAENYRLRTTVRLCSPISLEMGFGRLRSRVVSTVEPYKRRHRERSDAIQLLTIRIEESGRWIAAATASPRNDELRD
jgi:hypothetical protein